MTFIAICVNACIVSLFPCIELQQIVALNFQFLLKNGSNPSFPRKGYMGFKRSYNDVDNETVDIDEIMKLWILMEEKLNAKMGKD